MQGKSLVIVESPSKAKTIGKYLGTNYKVMASVGHVRDLPKSKMGIDIENNFEPEYISIRGKAETIKSLKEAAKKADKVFLATDPDREGEAISWHLAYILGIDINSNSRITFNEITKNAVSNAIKNPRPIDVNLVDAQQARRVLDRLVGYKVSPVLWTKVKRGLSAGRVQSAALKIICDREKEINSFVPREYWNIACDFIKDKVFTAKLTDFDGKKINIENELSSKNVIADLKAGKFVVKEVNEKEKVKKPFPPYTTSTLQQDASIRLFFPSKKTMRVAQDLYEGLEIQGHGNIGLVTYIRTDSVRISDEAKGAAKEYIFSHFGEEYWANNSYQNKKKEIQDAHEAIRPSHIELDPEAIKSSLTPDQYKLYKLIWLRFMASQMKGAKFDTTQVEIENGKYGLRANGQKMTFEGYQKLYRVESPEDEEEMLPKLSSGEILNLEEIRSEQKFTEPPSRFTEASLIKELEEDNIGRPSTYATILTTLIEKLYVDKVQKSLIPTDLGMIVSDYMSENFKDIVDKGFTADMEDKLDDIELKGSNWRDIVRDFYKPLEGEIDKAMKEKRVEMPAQIKEGEFCEKCGKPMAIKSGRFGEFLACTGYPECKTTRPIITAINVKCPDCGKDIIQKRSKKGKAFYGCSGYPNCTRAYWDKPINKVCPKCGEYLVEKKLKDSKLSCSNPNCNYKE